MKSPRGTTARLRQVLTAPAREQLAVPRDLVCVRAGPPGKRGTTLEGHHTFPKARESPFSALARVHGDVVAGLDMVWVDGMEFDVPLHPPLADSPVHPAVEQLK